MAHLAGKLSDGIVTNIATPPIIEEIVEHAREGAREAGRDPAELDVVSKIRVSLHEDADKARWALKKVLTFYSLQKGYSEVLCQQGWEPVVRSVQEAHKAQGFAKARTLIPDEMVDAVPMYAGSDLSGLPEKLDGYAKAGSTRCVVAYVPAGDDLWGEIKHFLEIADFARAAYA
jgi:alkanesulfonate monooxygenase SsuD/methylene tetrahydromethanopterin reductase-like flavin-dependent oxidoreductase (luciferase family)